MHLAFLRAAILLLLIAITSCATSSDSGIVIDTGYVDAADGVRLFYRVVGSGSDTVVVVHGGPGAGMEAVRLDFAPLAAGRSVVYYDQRGGGRSTLPADTSLLGAREHVGDLEAIRSFFGLERMDVVAHSFGSILVSEYAKSHPERLRRMVFLGATEPRRRTAGQLARNRFAGADGTLLDRMYRPMSALLSGTANDPIEACKDYHAAGARLAVSLGEPSVEAKGSECEMDADALRYYFKYTAQISPASFGQWDYTSSLESLDATLLVISGARDSLALSAQHEWTEAVDSAKLLAIPEAGKAAHVERPSMVFDAIDAFLKGTWPEGAE